MNYGGPAPRAVPAAASLPDPLGKAAVPSVASQWHHLRSQALAKALRARLPRLAHRDPVEPRLCCRSLTPAVWPVRVLSPPVSSSYRSPAQAPVLVAMPRRAHCGTGQLQAVAPARHLTQHQSDCASQILRSCRPAVVANSTSGDCASRIQHSHPHAVVANNASVDMESPPHIWLVQCVWPLPVVTPWQRVCRVSPVRCSLHLTAWLANLAAVPLAQPALLHWSQTCIAALPSLSAMQTPSSQSVSA
mmetsp:Transcript_22902/g.52475  ORF Transcript_22902/g.52475 Transcript_22902/m.52475 type:complete len:247 (-) Transcript_22902:162-902(-)